MTLAEFFKDYGAPIAWIVAAVGWGISNRQANTREKRKEFRSEIDVMEKVTKEIVVKLTRYFNETKEEEITALGLEIKVLFQELTMKWERILRRRSGGEYGLFFDDCAKRLEDFFDFSTGEYFELAQRIEKTNVGNHILQIHTRAFVFIESLHQLFLKKFDGI